MLFDEVGKKKNLIDFTIKKYQISASSMSIFHPILRRGAGDDYFLSFQDMFTFYILQHGHLLDSYLVEFLETFALRQTFIDKYCI